MKRLMVLVIIIALLFTFAVPALAVDTPDLIWAVDHESFNLISTPSSMSLYDANRVNPQNAYGPFDAIQSGSTNMFFSVGYAESGGVTYTFGTNKVINNVDALNNGGYDAGVCEVTWGNSWHVEAVDVYLVDAKVNGVVQTELNIGTLFNKVGMANGLGAGGLDVMQQNIGNFALTWFNFPNTVEYARAIKLVDVTAKYNEGNLAELYGTDGYDVDAIFAYNIIDTPTDPISVSAKKFIDIDENGIKDGDDYFKDGFVFTATKREEVKHATSGVDGVIDFGMFDADDVGSWTVVETPRAGFRPTNYPLGTAFEIIKTNNVLSVRWDQPTDGVAYFGNADDINPISVTAMKFIDINENGIKDVDDYFSGGFEFTATKDDEVRYVTSGVDGVINFGMFDKDDVGIWTVAEIPIARFHKTNYALGTAFEIIKTNNILSVRWDQLDEGVAHFGNANDRYDPTPIYIAPSEITDVAGIVIIPQTMDHTTTTVYITLLSIAVVTLFAFFMRRKPE